MNQISIPNDFTDCQALAFFDIPDLAYKYSLDKRKLERLIDPVEIPNNGSKVVYFLREMPIHYGIFWHERVISKFGRNGGIYIHKLNEIPYDYDTICFYTGILSDINDLNEQSPMLQERMWV